MVGNAVTTMLVGNVAVFFILRNGERMKVKEKSIGLVVHTLSKHGVRTVGRQHCSLSDYLIIKDDLLDYCVSSIYLVQLKSQIFKALAPNI